MATHEGEFQPEGTNEKLHYRVESWVEQDDWPNRKEDITDDDLPRVDFLVVKVFGDNEETESQYDTVWGPFDDWGFLEDYLAYDFGEDGSLRASTSGSA